MNNSFSKFERIKKRKEFDLVFEKGFFIKHFKCYNFCYCISAYEKSRLGIIVRKKYGKAHIRNYEKRLVREFFRKNKNLLLESYDIIVLIKSPSSSFDQKNNDFLAFLSFLEGYKKLEE